MSGFVHAPTEELAGATWRLLGQDEGPTVKGLIWNAGFYLWRQGSSPTLAAGLAKAEGLLRDGRCEALRQAMAGTSP